MIQGADEQIAWTLTTTPWGSSPTSIALVLKNAAGTDVTATNVTGSSSAVGDVITTGLVHSLTAGIRYRMEVKFTCSGNVFEAFGFIDAEA
jgi:hypothetical protein